MRPFLFSLFFSLTALVLSSFPMGCASSDGPVSMCQQLCDELVNECSYPAFPELESCLQGCGYNEAEGGDTEAHLACVQEAACDTFAVVECENHHGATSDE